MAAGVLAVASIGGVNRAFHDPPEPAKVARDYLDLHYPEIVNEGISELSPGHPLEQQITDALVDSISHSILPYSCTHPTGWDPADNPPVTVHCLISATAWRPMDVRLKLPVQFIVDADLDSRRQRLKVVSTLINIEVASVNGQRIADPARR